MAHRSNGHMTAEFSFLWKLEVSSLSKSYRKHTLNPHKAFYSRKAAGVTCRHVWWKERQRKTPPPAGEGGAAGLQRPLSSCEGYWSVSRRQKLPLVHFYYFCVSYVIPRCPGFVYQRPLPPERQNNFSIISWETEPQQAASQSRPAPWGNCSFCREN